MTSLNVAVGPIGNCPGVSPAGVEDSSATNNLPSIGSVPIGQSSIPRNASLVGSRLICPDFTIQHSGVGSCLVEGEIPGETTTE